MEDNRNHNKEEREHNQKKTTKYKSADMQSAATASERKEHALEIERSAVMSLQRLSGRSLVSNLEDEELDTEDEKRVREQDEEQADGIAEVGENGALESPIAFPEKLMSILNEEQCIGIIQWTEDGSAFRVHDRAKLSSNVLPRHFGEAEYRSFTRRLLRWGFKRISRGLHSGAFQHQLFHRDKPELCKTIQTCQKLKTAERKQIKRLRAAAAAASAVQKRPASVAEAGRRISDTAHGKIASKSKKIKSRTSICPNQQDESYQAAAATFRIAALELEQEENAISQAAARSAQDSLMRFAPPSASAGALQFNSTKSRLPPHVTPPCGVASAMFDPNRAAQILTMERQLLQQQRAAFIQQHQALQAAESTCLHKRHQQQQLQHLQQFQVGNLAALEAATMANTDLQTRLMQATLGSNLETSRLARFFQGSPMKLEVTDRTEVCLRAKEEATPSSLPAKKRKSAKLVLHPTTKTIEQGHETRLPHVTPHNSSFASLNLESSQISKEAIYQSIANNMQRRIEAERIVTLANIQHALALEAAQSRARAAAMAEVSSHFMRNQSLAAANISTPQQQAQQLALQLRNLASFTQKPPDTHGETLQGRSGAETSSGSDDDPIHASYLSKRKCND